MDITIGRAVIEMPSVLGDTRDADNHWNYLLPEYPGIGYVRITNFGERTSQELRTALAWLAERDVRGLILDLRNNRGGVFDEACGNLRHVPGSGTDCQHARARRRADQELGCIG